MASPIIDNTVLLVDERLEQSKAEKVSFILQQGPAQTAYVPLSSVSHSNQTTTFNLNNISQFTARDSRMCISLTATATLNVVNNTGSPIYAINSDNFGVKQFPYNRCVQNINHKINQASYSLNTNQILAEIARVKVLPDDVDFYDNTQPDNVDSYENATGSNLNPIASYSSTIQGDGIYKPRNLNYTVSGNQIAANNSGTVTVTLQIYEPLISPFNNIGKENDHALFAITGEIINITYVTDLFNNMFAYALPTGLTLSSASVSLGNSAILNCVYLTPSEEQIARVPQRAIKHYNDFQVFSTPVGAVAAGQTVQTASTVASFTNIPQKVLVYARLSDGSRLASTPDKYLAIDQISISFDNGVPVLSSATPNQLYDISVRNGLQMSRSSFLQRQLNTSVAAASASAPLFGCGSVLVLDPAMDLNLRPSNTNGSTGRFIFQIQNINLTNKTLTNFSSVTLYVVAVTNGILERVGGEYRNFLLSVADEQVLSTKKEMAPIARDVYSDLKTKNLFMSGGGFGDWLKGVAKKGLNLAANLASEPNIVGKIAQIGAKKYLGQGGATMFKDIHPKKRMDLFFE